MRDKYRLAAVLVMLIGVSIAIPFIAQKAIINTTPSAPIGIWWTNKNSISVERGDFVLVPVEYFAGYANYSGYPFKKTSWGKRALMLKQVGGIEGDKISGSDEGIHINGVLVEESNIISRDRAGNELKPFPLPYELRDDELWLISRVARGFDSRYLGYIHKSNCRPVKPLLIFK